MTHHVVNLRGWPGLDGWKPPTPAQGYADGLGRRNALVLYAAETDNGPLAAAVLISGPSVIAGALLVRDKEDTGSLRAVKRWAKGNPLRTSLGPKPWQVLTFRQFFDPMATVGCGHVAFTPNAYVDMAFVLGADLGRFFGLVADHVVPRKGKNADSWDVWLPGWGTPGPKGNWRRTSPHRPCLRLTHRRVGWQVEFGPVERGCGKIDPRTGGSGGVHSSTSSPLPTH